MDLVKKNLVSIICGVVALVAVGAIFWPIQGQYGALRASVDARAKVATEIDGILRKPRNLPIIEVPESPAKTLEVFPTKPVVEAWKTAVDKLKADSADMLTEAVKINTHQLLVPNSLPTGDTNTAIRFRDTYHSEMDMSPDHRKDSMIVRTLQGGFVPTESEINTERQRVEADFRAQFRDPGNDPALTQLLKDRRDKVPDDLRKKVADESLVYISTAANVSDPWTNIMTAGGNTPTATDIFIAQVGYWVEKDVLDSLANANKGKASVRESAVKHLISFKFAPSAFTKLQAQPGAPQQDTATAQWPPPNFTISITGRDSNATYDVYRFDLTLVADAEQIPRVLQELSRGKFITVTRCDVITVDSGARKAGGFDYGDKPVVQLSLQGEALMLRQWTRQFMPLPVQKALAIPQDQPKPQ